uniref:Uncharacterized protein n=1 Tax=Vitis vinifera TaxID=29760 RepID=A5B0W4_VITVI|nr:hypothetical protein VITISV_038722 [Vitis vinifera]
MKTLFMSQDVWDLVENGFDEPENVITLTPLEKDQLKELKQMDAKTLLFIQQGVGNNIFPRIMRASKAKEAWDILQQEFQGDKKTRSIKLQALRRELENMKMKENETLNELSSRFMELVNQMKSYGEEINDKRIVEKLLISLPDKFNPIVVVIEETKDLSLLSVAELDEEKQEEEMEEVEKDSTMEESSLTKKAHHSQSVIFVKEVAMLKKIVGSKGSLNASIVKNLGMLKKIPDLRTINKQVVLRRKRCPTKALLNNTTIETWSERKPSIRRFKVFGCLCYSQVPKERSKLDETSEKCIFMGYSSQSKGYSLYNLKTNKTFAPIAHLDTIRTVTTVATQKENKVYKLKKALYGLKQAPYAWYTQIDNYFIENGFIRSKSELTLYVKSKDNSQILIVALYVDDLIFIGNDEKMGGCIDDMQSTSGYAFSFGSSVISWVSKKQGLVAQSPTEVQYSSASLATSQAIWLRRILEDIKEKQNEATYLLCDNKSAIAIAKNYVFHSRTRHIVVKYHFIKEAISYCEVQLMYCKLEEQVADIFTKALPLEKLVHFRKLLGVEEHHIKGDNVT